MTQEQYKRTIFAPAKINLYLHVIKRLKSGYHKIDSLVAFCDIGDEITITPYDGFSLQIDGPFAACLDQPKAPINLVVKAAKSLSEITGNPLNYKISLTKNLPVAAGIGGGSTDATATLCGLMDIWKLPKDAQYLPALLESLGADMPVCMACSPSKVTGIGEIIEPVHDLPEIPMVLANPLKPCPTKDVFTRFHGTDFKKVTPLPKDLHDIHNFVSFLKKQENALQAPAMETVPEIGNLLNALSLEENCLLSRMSGSGATVFGLFETENDAQKAARHIAAENPDWWVKHGWLNRVGRY